MAELMRLMANDNAVQVTFYNCGNCCIVEMADRGVKMRYEGYTDTVVEILRDLGVLRG